MGFEAGLTIFLSTASTVFFCLYNPDSVYIAARLDFTIIGSAVVFPVTFLIAETFRRREARFKKWPTSKRCIVKCSWRT